MNVRDLSENSLEGGKRTCCSASTPVEGDHIYASSGRRGYTQLVRTASLVSKGRTRSSLFPTKSSSRNLEFTGVMGAALDGKRDRRGQGSKLAFVESASPGQVKGTMTTAGNSARQKLGSLKE